MLQWYGHASYWPEFKLKTHNTKVYTVELHGVLQVGRPLIPEVVAPQIGIRQAIAYGPGFLQIWGSPQIGYTY